MGLIQKAFSDIITFSRSSNATRVGPTGLVEYAPHNLQVRSQEFENAIWTKSGASITANATAAPDGTVTSDKLVEDSSGNHQTYQIGLTVVAQSYTASVYAKAAERTNIWLALFNGTNNGGVYFNLANGTAGSLGTDVTAASITPAGNGWYRCSITRTMVASANAGINIQLADSTPSISYVGNGSSGVFIWGAQLAVGPYALDYTPTTSAAVYGPRFDFDPVTLAARGLLIEEQRTNNFTYSQLFSNAAWLKDRSSVTLSGSAPDGTVSAFLLAEDTAAANDHYMKYAASTFSANTWTLSVFAKKSTRSAIGLRMLTGLSNYVTVVFNLDTGLETKRQSDGGFSAINATSTAFGNGWYRLTLTATAAGSFDAAFLISNSTTPTIGVYGEIAYNGDGSSGVLIWGAQFESSASFATSYIPTLASTVTRSADVASVNTLSPFYNQTEGTLFVEATMPQSNNSRLAQIGVSGFSYLTQISFESRVVGGTDVRFTTYNDPAYVNLYSPTLSVRQIFKGAGAYKNSDIAASFNGNTAVTSSTANSVYSSMTILGIGQGDGGAYANAHIRRIAYYPRRLSNAELQAITA